MRNLDKAADLILPHTGNCEKCESVGGACLDCEREANDAALALADAGLLVPDTTGALASMWARGKAQPADLALFKASGAPIPEWAWTLAPKGEVTTQDLINYWATGDTE